VEQRTGELVRGGDVRDVRRDRFPSLNGKGNGMDLADVNWNVRRCVGG